MTRTILLTATLYCATSALAQTLVFHSESSGSFSILSDPTLPVFDVGIDHPVVNATPFPMQSLAAVQTVSLLGPPSIAGSFTLTDLEGDLLFGSYFADLMFLGPTESVADGAFSFTGGTGRYEDASGGGRIAAAIHLASGTSEIILDGHLVVPESGGVMALASLVAVGITFVRRRSVRNETAVQQQSAVD
jgi:hypothetical protein